MDLRIVLAVVLLIGLSEGQQRRVRRQEREGTVTVSNGPNTDSNDVNGPSARRPNEAEEADGGGGGEELDVVDIPASRPQEGFFISFDRMPSLNDMLNQFQHMQDLFRLAEERIANLTANIPDNARNTTEEIVEIGGRRFKLVRTVSRRTNGNSEFFFSATSLQPVEDRRRKRSTTEEDLHCLRCSQCQGGRFVRSVEDNTSETSEEQTNRNSTG